MELCCLLRVRNKNILSLKKSRPRHWSYCVFLLCSLLLVLWHRLHWQVYLQVGQIEYIIMWNVSILCKVCCLHSGRLHTENSYTPAISMCRVRRHERNDARKPVPTTKHMLPELYFFALPVRQDPIHRNLWTRDTMGPMILSLVERSSLSQRSNNTQKY